jgi:hypothetical protein
MLLLAGCTSRVKAPTQTTAATIAWADCRSDAPQLNPIDYTVECGTVVVPQDWRNLATARPSRSP